MILFLMAFDKTPEFKTSNISGKIVKVLVDDATPVEFDQPLFLVEP